MNARFRIACATAFTLLLTAAVAWAQATAQMSGRVTDESGAVLPGVTVTATQADTGFTRTVVTDETGSYVMPNLPTGPYRLEASLQGFRTYAQTGIVLQVGATPTLNAVLAVGNLEETVSVEAAAPLIDVQSAGIGEVVENERIVELPLQGRQVTDLIMLAGGAVQTGTASNRAMQGGVGVSVAGGQSFGVAYLLDGAMHNNPQDNLNLPLPFPDALQEFSVATGGLSAQNGMHSGAAVSAVTKSGTNRLAGNLFEFLRDKRFNATDPFAQVGPDGRRRDDGLVRHQFGGTLGGPIARDRLFFFGAYQGTAVRQTPATNIVRVPTAAMLAGDFTAFASPACNAGRQVALRAPFVNNRVEPARFSPAAVNLARRLPTTEDPCGEITFGVPDDSNEGQGVGRVDYQLSANHSMFGRYMATYATQAPAYETSGNLLTTPNAGFDNLAQSVALGDTIVFGSNVVNSLRFAYNRTSTHQTQVDFFEPSDLGVKVYSYIPHRMVLTITDGFNISSGIAVKGDFETNAFQLGDDVTMVRGRHQISVGGNMAYWTYDQVAHARSGGNWTFNGQATGLGLADFLVGRLAILEHGGPTNSPVEQWYFGIYGQDTWRAAERVTFNLGLRWEPFFGAGLRNNAIYNFNVENFRQGIRSSVYLNAPAGLVYPGDPGFPEGNTGLNTQWWNLSPRLGAAWDVRGDGRTAVRSSYGLAYDFPTAEYHFINSSAPPFGNRSRVEDPPGLFDDPYGHLGGDPHPILTSPTTPFVRFGTFGSIDPDINSPRVQSWNVTLEQQLATNWGAAVSYLGSYSDRIWGLVAMNPGVFLGLGPCTIHGVAYPVCSTNANLNQRRALYLENPDEAQFIGALDQHTDEGTQDYRGLKLSLRRRAAAGISLNANYTWSRCMGNATPTSFSQISAGYTNPADPEFDRGYCDQDRPHLGSLTMGAQTPDFEAAALRLLASGWRVSGIVTARSGSRLNITTGRDNAFNGISAQRVSKVSDDVYGPKTLDSYLNAAAFAQPASGTFGDLPYNALIGPGFWNIDLALSRMFAFGGTRNLEVRVESFNLLNTFNWGNPTTNLTSAQFGRIRSSAGSPRVMQFGVKYGF
jgi:hypothetical protein